MESVTISLNKMTVGIALVITLIIGLAIGLSIGGHGERGGKSCGFGGGMRGGYEQSFRNRGNMMNTKTSANLPVRTEVKNGNTTPPVKPTVVNPVNTVTPTTTKQ